MSYFTAPIKARSEEERAKRIADNESKGFELVKTFEKEIAHRSWDNNGYNNGGKAVFRYAGDTSRVMYCAVMRRDNSDYLERKAKEKAAT